MVAIGRKKTVQAARQCQNEVRVAWLQNRGSEENGGLQRQPESRLTSRDGGSAEMRSLDVTLGLDMIQ